MIRLVVLVGVGGGGGGGLETSPVFATLGSFLSTIFSYVQNNDNFSNMYF
jgi:hypothetical protein